MKIQISLSVDEVLLRRWSRDSSSLTTAQLRKLAKMIADEEPTARSFTVYRGISEEDMQDEEPGYTWKLQSPMSTTYDRSVAKRYGDGIVVSVTLSKGIRVFDTVKYGYAGMSEVIVPAGRQVTMLSPKKWVVT